MNLLTGKEVIRKNKVVRLGKVWRKENFEEVPRAYPWVSTKKNYTIK